MRGSAFTVVTVFLTVATPAFADDGSASAAEGANEPTAETPKAETRKTDAARQEDTAEVQVMLHVDAPQVVAIEREDTGEVVCKSPCDRLVPATVRYRIGGSRPSEPFTLDARDGTAKLTVAPASKRDFWAGIGALGAGGALVAGGIVALSLGYANRPEVPGAEGTVTDNTYTDTMIVGTTLIVSGLAAGIWGGATALANRRTTVEGSVVKAPPARGDAQPPRVASPAVESTRRVDPAWSAGRTFFVPLLSGVF